MAQKRLTVLGAGESGVGAAILGVKEGFDVFVSDSGEIKDKYKSVLSDRSIRWEENGHDENLILGSDLVVKSPGIPDSAKLVVKLIERGIPVISEIEFAGRYTQATTVCITGSNGKTTTTMLTYEMLKGGGLNVGIAGNVGHSFAWQVAENDYDVYVIELSSFQLDGMYEFRADIAVLLNITPDHLDRYEYDMQKYIDSKFRILQNQQAQDSFIYSSDDPVIAGEIKKRKIVANELPFSLLDKQEEGAWLEDELVKFKINNKTFSMSMYELALKGKHNINNSMAAGISAMVLKLRKEDIRQCLTNFHGVEHRLERFLKVHGIEFVNDSKATNINSTWYALESMGTNVVWIAGGVDKGNDYSELYDLAREKVKALICLGKDNRKISEAFEGVIENIVETDDMDEAVRSSYFLAEKGDTVLLSPACASFDIFSNYEERGRLFKEAVRNL
jgi:UDP-N-acetylmuramoylalanine--D-glutamate ligase